MNFFKLKNPVTGRYFKLEPMNPAERRIIHTALQNDDRVTTLSKGSEPKRYVIIFPKEYKESKSGIFIPSTVKEDMPRKGVVIQIGAYDPDNHTLSHLYIGDIVTHGIYAGKELEISFEEPKEPIENWKELIDSNKFVVLSYNEIIFIESQNLEL